MTISVIGLSIDCADPAAVARFWSEVLGRPVNSSASDDNAAIDATAPESGPRLTFHKVPEPKTVKNRLHLDLRTNEFEAETERLLRLGRRRVYGTSRNPRCAGRRSPTPKATSSTW